MGKLLIYPFQEEISSLCRFQDLLENGTSVLPVAPRGLGLEGEDSAKSDGGEPTGIIVQSNFYDALKECNHVFFDLAPHSSLPASHYSQLIKDSLSESKPVKITKTLLEFLQKSNESIDTKALEVLGFSPDEMCEDIEENLLDLPVPCITVLGAGEECNKFATQLGIVRYFKKKGYNVAFFGTKEYTSLFGFGTLPSFLFEAGSQRNKILKLNHYVYDNVKKNHADLVVIGCPGAIMRDNPFKFKEYGELAFVIGNAVKADISVLSLYSAPYTSEAIQYLLHWCKYRLNAIVKHVCLACKDIVLDQESMECKYITTSLEFVQKTVLPEVNTELCDVFSSLDSAEIRRLGEVLENELLNNV